MSAVKLRFEPDLAHQIDAVASVVDLFDGMQRPSQLPFTDIGFGNPMFAEGFERAVIENLRRVQARNRLPDTSTSDGLNFTVEMETGTGKTYVYLRTIFEMNRQYGFTKFVIVVPSVAIREGVLSSIKAMGDHFRSIYSVGAEAAVYDPRRLGRLRQFATSNTLQILVINIDAFQKDTNIINRPNDRMDGRPPIEFIQSCRPIVVIDEPQNVESELRTAALSSLHPLCTIGYSATHKTLHHPVYRLGPSEAHALGLVKSVEVASVTSSDVTPGAFVQLQKLDRSKWVATLLINAGTGSKTRQTSVRVRCGDDLFAKSGGRSEYASGYVVENMSVRDGDPSVWFSNGSAAYLDSSVGGLGDAIRRAQIRTTVRAHLECERNFQSAGRHTKVLSLFFIDRVANYPTYVEWFQAEYADLASQPEFADLELPPAAESHAAYFAQDGKGNARNSTGKGADDVAAYDLIMRNKAALLDPTEPRRFIFSHSALREGWDNPNVFQICTLNQANSKDRKRQEIGRGLRLPVDGNGVRVRDQAFTRLTVIANESYQQFARNLQRECAADTSERRAICRTAFSAITNPDAGGEPYGDTWSTSVWGHLVANAVITEEGDVGPQLHTSPLPLPGEYGEASEAIRAELFRQMGAVPIRERGTRQADRKSGGPKVDPAFEVLWQRAISNAQSRVNFDSEAIIEAAVEAIRRQPPVEPPKIVVQRGPVGGRATSATEVVADNCPTASAELPDIITELQDETRLTRRTIVRVLVESGRIQEFPINPHSFIKMCSAAISSALRSVALGGGSP